MANNQDARPFVDLQKDSEEFVAKFVEDIEECKSLLDVKITSLICDPDSIGHSVGPKQNALVEFSKAKYEIFVKMKSFMNEKEKEWQKYISEMKKLFLENVEIFLAGTKLEIKLPASEYQSSAGLKKSPGSRKSGGVASSIYPIISSITKNIPGLNAYGVETMDTDESDTVLAVDNIKVRVRKSLSPAQNLKQNSFLAPLNSSDMSEDEEISEPDQLFMLDISPQSKQGQGYKGQITTQNRRSNANGVLPKNVTSSELQGETHELESAMNSDLLPKGRNRRGKQSVLNKKDTEISTNSKNISDESEEEEETETSNNVGAVKGRRGKQAAKTKANVKALQPEKVVSKQNSNISDESEEMKETESNNTAVPVRRGRRKQAAKTEASAKTLPLEVKSISKKKSNSISDESEEVEEIKTSNTLVPVRRGRGKQAAKSEASAKTLAPESKIISKNNSNSISDEGEEVEEIETNNTVVPVKRGRGKQAAKSEASTKTLPSENKVVSKKNSNSISDESEDVKETEANNNVVPVRRGKGKQTAKSKANDETLKMPVRPIRRKTVIERVIEAETSVSPKKVTFTEEDLSDDLDVPVTKPSKSAARRKTLFPNLEEAESGADIIPGNSTRARYKRKTISGVAELTSVAPSKRLKASSNQKSNAQDEGSSADDNLLEINDSYSDWIPLKSIDGKIPTTPAIYEVKVWRAKKTAFIGSCDSLRQKLTLHKLRQNSGHKHLDKFIERNFNDIQVRYEVVSSMNDAKVEVKNRINNFVAQHKTTPAYN